VSHPYIARFFIVQERHMKRGWSAVIIAVLLTVLLVSLTGANSVALVGTGVIPGNLTDLSGLAGSQICRREDSTDCIDQATLGGFGSALAYTGFNNVFVSTPDRGPFDGRTDVPYLDRFHLIQITVDLDKSFPNIKAVLLDTRFLTDHRRRNLVGDAYAFDTEHPVETLRFDPEGVAVGPFGTIFVSDEYGPYVREFDRHGRLIRRIPLPAKFRLDPATGQPSGDVDSAGNSVELYPTLNVTGRQANRGMEGLTITPNGRTLVGIMQNALLQDNGINPTTIGRVGVNNRIVTIDLVTGKKREYVYVMDAVNQGRGVNDLLAINDHEFLVLERDNRTFVPTPPNTAQSPNLKRIYRIDLAQDGLTDVSDVESLPQGALDPSIVPVTKTLFLDLLDPSYVVSTSQLKTVKDVIAEKVEALAWGPKLKDGRLLLYVATDNDLFPDLPTQVYAFAIDAAAAGVKYRPQTVLFPVLFPWEVPRHGR
jgi:hypothetical protein